MLGPLWASALTAQQALRVPTPDNVPSPPGQQLEAATWELVDYLTGAGLKHMVSDAGRSYVQFGEGRFRMNAGCGTLRGSYLLEGDRLLFSPHVAAFIRDCPETLAKQEKTLLSLLSRITRVQDTADGIALVDSEGETLLTLATPEAVPLQGRRWRLIAYRGRDAMIRAALPAPAVTLWFENATNLAGVACDRYSASFTREERFLSLQGSVATTRFGCTQSPEARRQGEDFIEALSAMEAYRVDGDTLLLRDRDGRMLARFQAMSEQSATADRPASGLANGARQTGPGRFDLNVERR